MLAPAARQAHASLFGTDVVGLPTGTTMTPDAAPGSVLFALDPHVASAPELRASNAVALAVSPDGRTLLVLTAGYNLWFDRVGAQVDAGSSQWVFVYDLAGGVPREVDAVAVPNTFCGVAFAGVGRSFFVSGGPDDVVREYAPGADGKYAEVLPAVALGHLAQKDAAGGLGIDEGPFAAGIGPTPSGARLVVANNENDTLSILDMATRRAVAEVPLRPGGGVAGGEFPYGLIVMDEHRAFVTSQRDHEIVEVDLDAARVLRRIRVGSSPTTITRNRRGNRLYVTNANSDTVSVVDVAAGVVVSELQASALPSDVPTSVVGRRTLTGANPNDAALSPDEKTLYVTLGGNNAVAVLALSSRDRGEAGVDVAPSRTLGLIPTGFYPHAVTPSADGRFLYVAFAKSPSGPNPDGPWSDPSRPVKSVGTPGMKNEYSLQLQHGGLHVFPVPDARALTKLTAQTLINNRFLGAPAEDPIFSTLRRSVRHVIYVVSENRSYDQILGDLPGADGDPRLVHWPARITPNQHAIARTFVTFDRFFDTGGVSGDGWEWSTMGRSTDVAEKVIPLEYAGRGNHSYDWEGTSRNVNVAGATVADRIAANPDTPDSKDLMPGSVAVGEVDEPNEGGRGLLWDAALEAGRGVRNYGFFLDLSRYGLKKEERGYLPLVTMPFDESLRVAFPARPSLMAVTDPYFWGFDMALADFWREKEWERELDAFSARGELPSLELVRLPHDHLGSFARARDGVDTPDTQMADHDYALGRMVERLSRSPFWTDTVLIALEDDAQNGSDHVDAHRSMLFLAGGHVRRGAVVSSVYATPSVLRTIELLLALEPLGQADAFAPAMADAFQSVPDVTPFTAIVPSVLHSTALPLPAPPVGATVERPRGDRAAWATATKGYDFSRADAVPTAEFNRLLYCQLVAGAGCASD
jgi:YVTN family beta-propeller protein